MGNPEGRDALRSAVNTFLIKSGKYYMIAVDAIDVMAQEQRRQMSGEVSDGDIAALGRAAGAQYVYVVQRSELAGVSYVATRIVSAQSKAAEQLADKAEVPRGVKAIDIIQWQISSMLGMPVGPRPAGATQPAMSPVQTVSAHVPQTPSASVSQIADVATKTTNSGSSLTDTVVIADNTVKSLIIKTATVEKIFPCRPYDTTWVASVL
jgi:hypothetical protein